MSKKSKIIGLVIVLLVVVGLVVLDSSNPLLSVSALFFVFGMAGSFSDYLENKVLDHVLGGGDYTRPATVYVALFTAAPTDAGGGTEVTGGSYARVAVTNNATNWPAASGGAKSNGTDIAFAEATADWGNIAAFGIFDAITSGNLMKWGDLTVSKDVDSGDTAKFAVGELDITLD